MNDQHVGKLVKDCFALDVHCLLACTTLETFNELSSRQALQTIVDRALVFDLQGQVIELVIGFLNVTAGFAYSDGALLTSENVLKKVLHRGLRKHALDPAESNSQKLL